MTIGESVQPTECLRHTSELLHFTAAIAVRRPFKRWLLKAS